MNTIRKKGRENNTDTPSWVIAGLGNPGQKYESTRHNIGAAVVDSFVEQKGDILIENDCMAFIPDCYMNLSGGPVAKALGNNKKERTEHAKSLIVVHDDLDIPFGEVKISIGRGAGGHNGVADIIKAIGTKDFIRVRIGIVPVFFGTERRPKGKAVETFVLKSFSLTERCKIQSVITKALQAIEIIVTKGPQQAMNEVN